MPRIDIVLTEAFPILSLTLVTEPLRLANREGGRARWSWRLLSVRGRPAHSSSGLALATEPLDDTPAEIVILLASYRPEAALTDPLLAWLRRRARHGALMGCVDTGALIFAEAGLLSERPAAAHFEALADYRDRYDDAMFADRLFDVGPTRCSSAGGVATFDMILALIARFDGTGRAARIAEVLCYRPTSHAGPQQRLLVDTSILRLDPVLAGAVDLMLGALEAPITITALARRVGVPGWRLARLFKRHLGCAPSAYYRRLRLEHARALLANPGLPISQIALRTGFDSPEGFARAYRRHFSRSATEDRRDLQTGSAGP